MRINFLYCEDMMLTSRVFKLMVTKQFVPQIAEELGIPLSDIELNIDHFTTAEAAIIELDKHADEPTYYAALILDQELDTSTLGFEVAIHAKNLKMDNCFIAAISDTMQVERLDCKGTIAQAKAIGYKHFIRKNPTGIEDLLDRDLVDDIVHSIKLNNLKTAVPVKRKDTDARPKREDADDRKSPEEIEEIDFMPMLRLVTTRDTFPTGYEDDLKLNMPKIHVCGECMEEKPRLS